MPGTPSKLRIAFAVGTLPAVGGVSPAMAGLATSLHRRGHSVTIYTTDCARWPLGKNVLGPDVELVASDARWLGGLCYAPPLRRRMVQDLPRTDIVHCHSIWSLPNHDAAVLAHRSGKPLVFSLHGMLNPWALRQQSWKAMKKQFARWLFQDRDLRRAACLHALNRQEAGHFRDYGLVNPIAVIPNGVRLEEFDGAVDTAPLFAGWPHLAGKRLCLYFSKLHEGKGLAPLLDAWQRVAGDFPDWHLVLAGPDDGFLAEVRRRIEELRIGSCVTWTGALSGALRLAVLRAAGLFVLPSFSEGFSLAILEALTCRLPVLISPQCNFPSVAEAGAGLEIRPTAEGVEAALRTMMGMTDAQRQAMGAQGRALIEQRYTWDRVAGQMADLYAWLQGGGPAPEFVEVR